jgi:two-component system NtrC family sensor kinase
MMPAKTLDGLFDAARYGIYMGWFEPAVPAAAGVPLLANPSLKRILGYRAATPDGDVLLLAGDHFADASARERLLEAILSENGAHDYLVQLRRCDGTMAWVEITAAAGSDAPGPIRIDALVRDVTERRHREEHARALYQQLAHSEQLAAIGRTLADVAHELRNPLTAIVGWAERLAEQPLDEKSARGISEILSASERAARIVRNMLHSTRRQTSSRSMVDINDVVAETVSLRLHDQQAMNIAVQLTLEENIPAVLVDPHQIQQILLNLILNAEQAMVSANRRGALTLATRANEARHMAIVEVSDDGPGVPDLVRSRIFDPFFTTKQPGVGTGLGLAVAQAIAHEHGGSIRLDHERPKGSTFVVELPARGLDGE